MLLIPLRQSLAEHLGRIANLRSFVASALSHMSKCGSEKSCVHMDSEHENFYTTSKLGILIQSLAYWIAFGAHGPRAQDPPGEGWKVASMTIGLVGISCAIFAFIRYFAKGSPSTMTQEYQEATNEYLRVGITYYHVYGRH